MSVNNISSVNAADVISAYQSTSKKADTASVDNTTSNTSWSTQSVIYESGASDSESVSASSDRSAIVAQMQADLDARVSQMQNLIAEMMGQQGKAAVLGDGIWSLFANGEYTTVDEAAVAQAKEDIAEGGYWSVDKTSERILDFAVALAGDDPDNLSKMLEAFKTGYSKAEELWGGELPEISKQTYDSVLDKFDKLINKDTETES